ncbi:hypothetical protein M0R45_037602 [Rubus argutus]
MLASTLHCKFQKHPELLSSVVLQSNPQLPWLRQAQPPPRSPSAIAGTVVLYSSIRFAAASSTFADGCRHLQKPPSSSLVRAQLAAAVAVLTTPSLLHGKKKEKQG